MSIGSHLNIVAFHLEAMLRDVRQETLKILASGRSKNPANRENDEFFGMIQKWELQVTNFKRQLSQMEAGVAGQRAGIRGSRIEARRQDAYRLRQSLDDKTTRIAEVQELAAQVARELKRLLRLSINPTALDIEEDFGELAEHIIDSAEDMHLFVESLERAHHSQTLHASTVKELRNAIQHSYVASQTAQAPSIFDTITLLVTLIRILLMERIRNERQRKS
jgi:hypothetical protein